MHRVYLNIFEYLKGIRYEPETKELSRQEFEKYSQFNRYIKIKTTHEENGIMYLFLLLDTTNNSDVAKSFGKKKTESYSFDGMLNTITETKANVMFICKDSVIQQIKKAVTKYKKKEITLKTMSMSRFMLNVRNHILVPEHILCTEEEKESILDELQITSGMLPKIKITDAQVEWLNAKVGDVIKILRNDPTGRSIYYRVVIA